MPTYKTKNLRGDEVQSYFYSTYCFIPDPSDKAAEFLLNFRKDCAKELDELHTLQNQASKQKDYALAKYWKECISEKQKFYKACCFVIPHYVGYPPGDCKKFVRVNNFPCDLDYELTFILSKISIL